MPLRDPALQKINHPQYWQGRKKAEWYSDDICLKSWSNNHLLWLNVLQIFQSLQASVAFICWMRLWSSLSSPCFIIHDYLPIVNAVFLYTRSRIWDHNIYTCVNLYIYTEVSWKPNLNARQALQPYTYSWNTYIIRNVTCHTLVLEMTFFNSQTTLNLMNRLLNIVSSFYVEMTDK
jgi:hypothetical protein